MCQLLSTRFGIGAALIAGYFIWPQDMITIASSPCHVDMELLQSGEDGGRIIAQLASYTATGIKSIRKTNQIYQSMRIIIVSIKFV